MHPLETNYENRIDIFQKYSPNIQNISWICALLHNPHEKTLYLKGLKGSLYLYNEWSPHPPPLALSRRSTDASENLLLEDMVDMFIWDTNETLYWHHSLLTQFWNFVCWFLLQLKSFQFVPKKKKKKNRQHFYAWTP